MKKLFFLLTVTLVCAFAAVADNAPKYVFLFIGDGMGKPHVELARMKFGALNMDKLPVRGSVSTVNFERKTTDSAAAGTAFACGVKTRNSRLGIDADGNWIDSCAVLAKRQGRRCAVLTTVGVNNATPAAFYAHVMKRNESKKIMEQFPDSKIDILAGSGIDGMKKDVKPEDFLSGKAYQMEQTASAVKVDFTGNEIQVIAKDDAPFFALKSLKQPVLVYSPGVDDLAKYVQKSIELMQDSPDGFFMMAEGGHIDHGGHGNNAQYMLDEFRKFDQAIGVALKFYAQHPDDTLILVSADHHTGGLSLTDKINLPWLDVTPDTLKISCKKDAENVILEKMAAAKLDVNDKEKGDLHQAFDIADARKHENAVRNAVLHTIARNAGIAWSTYGHTSDEVYLFAIGKDADRFAGNQENSDVGAKLKKMFTPEKQVKAMAIYYPHWHVYPRGEEWFGKNWTEWEFVKTQAPRYSGHPVPIEPLMGYYDESKPENVEKEIELASDAGLDIFLYDWYCYDGEVIMQEALDNGFLKARNRGKMKFALMWCYHDRRNRFRAVIDDPGAELIMRAGTPDEFRKCFDIVLEKYLGRSEYYYKDGHPFFSIFNAVEFIAKMGGPEKVKALLDEADAKAVKKGLPTIHWNAMHIKSPHIPMLKAAGFDSCAAYNITCHDLPDYKARFNKGEQLFDYREVADIHRVFWQSFDNGGLMYLPTVTRGWDCSARCRNEEPFPWRAHFYPYVGIVRNNTPEIFKSLLADAKKRAENDPAKPGVVIINAWNEYTEGCWLVPDKNIGDASLQAVKSVFR